MFYECYADYSALTSHITDSNAYNAHMKRLSTAARRWLDVVISVASSALSHWTMVPDPYDLAEPEKPAEGENEPKAPQTQKRRRKVWIVAAVIVAVAVVSTLVTSFYGVRDVLRAGANELDAAAHGSYSSKVRTVGPFLIRVEHGWVDGPLSGRGERAVYFWFFGVTRKVAVLEGWDA